MRRFNHSGRRSSANGRSVDFAPGLRAPRAKRHLLAEDPLQPNVEEHYCVKERDPERRVVSEDLPSGNDRRAYQEEERVHESKPNALVRLRG